MYIHIHISVCVHAYICTQICVCVCVCLYMYMRIYVCEYKIYTYSLEYHGYIISYFFKICHISISTPCHNSCPVSIPMLHRCSMIHVWLRVNVHYALKFGNIRSGHVGVLFEHMLNRKTKIPPMFVQIGKDK